MKGILKEFDRIVKKKNGLMSHFIDMSDHFAHMDSSINIYNFLQFSPQEWKLIDNSIQPQNRLRFKNYKDIYQKLEIPITEENIRKGNLQELEKIKIDNSFSDFSKVEIAISHGYIVSDYMVSA